MKRASLYTAAAAILVVVLSALIAQYTIGQRALLLRQGAQNAYLALSAIRSIETHASRLRFVNHDEYALRSTWSQRNEAVRSALAQVDAVVQHIPTGGEHARRAADSWAGIESQYSEFERILRPFSGTAVARRISATGLTLAYLQMLNDPQVEDREAALVGLALNQLDNLDRRVAEAEAELSLLARLANEEANRIEAQVRHATFAIGVSVICGIAFFLHRMLLAHTNVSRESAARLAAEQAAAAKERDLQITLDSIGDAVISTDTEGRIMRMNPIAEGLTGWKLTEAQGNPLDSVFAIINERSRERVASPVSRVLETGAIVGLANHTILRHRDGSERPIADSAAPIRDTTGAIRGVVLVFRDVTEQYRLERQIRESQKMESVGQLAGGIAHDFNNLLQVITGNLSLVRDPDTPSSESTVCLQEIADASRRAAELCHQLLAFGRRQALEKRVVDVAQIVSTALKMIRRVIGENVAVEFHMEADSTFADVDSGQIHQVLLNLCINARDAMPNGGRLRVGLREIVLGADDLGIHPAAQVGHYLVLYVRDSGVGMDRETLSRIFDPFFTTKPVGKGTGLGLAVVQGIVHQHGGFIIVQSEPGIGTTFDLYFPAVLDEGTRMETGPDTERAIPLLSKGATVLLAEDETAVRAVAARLLGRSGYRVLEATDGEHACSLAASHDGPIALAIVDMVMPRLGGAEAARRLQATRPGLPVIIATGYAAGLLSGDELAQSGWLLLRKPYTVAELAEAIEKIAQRKSPA